MNHELTIALSVLRTLNRSRLNIAINIRFPRILFPLYTLSDPKVRYCSDIMHRLVKKDIYS